jgi:hypothetical protein
MTHNEAFRSRFICVSLDAMVHLAGSLDVSVCRRHHHHHQPEKEARKVVVIFDHEHFSQFPKQNSEDKQPRLGGGCGMDENRKRLTQDEGKQTK